jgi:hypothetical protein
MISFFTRRVDPQQAANQRLIEITRARAQSPEIINYRIKRAAAKLGHRRRAERAGA